MSEKLNNAIMPTMASVYIVNCGSGFVIDTSQIPVMQYTWNASGAQLFTVTLISASQNTYTIVQNGKALDVGNATQPAPVYLTNYSGTGTLSQQWSIVYGNGNQISFQNKASNLFLSIFSPLLRPNSSLYQTGWAPYGAQNWVVSSNSVSFILPGISPGRAIDDINGSGAAGNNYQVYQQNTTAAQFFLMVPIETTSPGNIMYYMLINQASAMPLTAAAGVVTQAPWISSDAQKWSLSSTGPNNFKLQNKPSGGIINASVGSLGTVLTCVPGAVTDWQIVPVSQSEDEKITERLESDPLLNR